MIRASEFSLVLGALADPLKQQLAEQNMKFRTARDAALCQRLADSLVHVCIGHLITESVLTKARRKLINKIGGCIEQTDAVVKAAPD